MAVISTGLKMNEKIKQFAEQAEDHATEEYDKWIPTSADDFSGIPNVRKIFNEMFAQLIVKECALTAGLMEHEGRRGIGAQILDNFGVEE